jgi:type II secretory pathway pseudopilin PulG
MPLTRNRQLRARLGAAAQRGLSIVELMVGVTIGLIVVAAASVLMSTQLVENRRLLAETQLQQDLRAAADIITRELRRSGLDVDLRTLQTMWYPGMPNYPVANGLTTLVPAAGASAQDSVSYRYATGTSGVTTFGFKLENDKIRTRVSSGGTWQDLTDGTAMKVTQFLIENRDATTFRVPCPKPCASGDASCWPTITVRNLEVTITAQSLADPLVIRSVRSKVRLRNDRVSFTAPGTPARSCPL